MFDKVYLINLKRRPDRLEAFRKRQVEFGWQLPEPEIFEAIDGNKVGCPSYYVSGGGAFGCARSHINCLEQCLMRGYKSALILEDDVCWQAEAWQQLETFMATLPDDWDALWLGGQLTARTQNVSPGVVRVTNIGRTQSYAVKGQGIKSLLHNWYACNRHIDHVLGGFCRANKVLSPSPFIFGQQDEQGGYSDISGKRNEGSRYWNRPTGDAPILWLDPSISLQVVNELRDKHRWHRGNWLDAKGYDNGLSKARGNTKAILKTIETLQWEVTSNQGKHVAIWHPDVTPALLKDCLKYKTTPVIEITGPTVEDCLKQLEEHAV